MVCTCVCDPFDQMLSITEPNGKVEVDIDLTEITYWQKRYPAEQAQTRRRASLPLEAAKELEDEAEVEVENEEEEKTLTLEEEVLEFLADPANEEEQEGMARKQLRQTVGAVHTKVDTMKSDVKAELQAMKGDVAALDSKMQTMDAKLELVGLGMQTVITLLQTKPAAE